MAVEVTEFYESREVSRTQADVTIIDIFTIKGESDPRKAEGYGPSFGAELDHDGVSTTVILKKAVRIAPDACRLTVTYGVPGGKKFGAGSGISGESWEMDLTAGIEHIVEVRKTEDQTNYTSEGEEKENKSKSIGDTLDGKIDGVDVYRPKATLTVTKYFEAKSISRNFMLIIYGMTGKTNDAEFKGWLPGSLLFLGARVRSAQEGFIPVVYTFLGSPEEKNIKIDIRNSAKGEKGSITIKEKKGWHYLWFKQVSWMEPTGETDKGGEAVEKKMIATGSAHVAKVYEEETFTKLGLSSELT